MTYIKICGITSLDIANCAVEAGADALGFVFAKSKRYIEPEKAKYIVKKIPKEVDKVGVFVNFSSKEVTDILEFTGLTVLQFHGNEEPEYCKNWSVPVWKAISIKDEASLAKMHAYDIDTFLLDSFSSNSYGGTGKVFDWKLAKKTIDSDFKVILAGGLNIDNIQQALSVVNPYGIDISSGVEINGIKNKELIKSFIKKVRDFDDRN